MSAHLDVVGVSLPDEGVNVHPVFARAGQMRSVNAETYDHYSGGVK